jgi:hypothetical protein
MMVLVGVAQWDKPGLTTIPTTQATNIPIRWSRNKRRPLMNRKLNLGLSIAAGLLGGFLSHYISPELVHAQAQAAPSKEIRAQRFVLVNDDGKPAGLLGFDQDGQPNVILLDRTGKVLWSASGKPNAKPLAVNLQK